MRELGKDSDWKEEYMTALDACIKISAEERAWAYHLSMDRAEADYRNGLELAEEKGRDEGLAEGLRNLMSSMSWTAAQAMDALKIPEADRDKYAAILTEN